MWFEQMHSGWQEALAEWKPFLEATEASLAQLPNLAPVAHRVMTAFQLDPEFVRVVIIGQDPYPGEGVAIGRAFAVSSEVAKLPQSLRNIFTELVADVGDANQSSAHSHPSPDLLGWQQQGVFLLNRHLTTTWGNPEAHVSLGWDGFTLAAVQHLVNRSTPPVLVLWGAHAQKLSKQLQNHRWMPRTSNNSVGAPEPALGFPWLFWIQAIQQGESGTSKPRPRADRLV